MVYRSYETKDHNNLTEVHGNLKRLRADFDKVTHVVLNDCSGSTKWGTDSGDRGKAQLARKICHRTIALLFIKWLWGVMPIPVPIWP